LVLKMKKDPLEPLLRKLDLIIKTVYVTMSIMVVGATLYTMFI